MDERNTNLSLSNLSGSAAAGDEQSEASARKKALRTLEQKGSEVAQDLENSVAAVEGKVQQAAATIKEKGNVAIDAAAKVSGRARGYVHTHDANDVVNDLRRVTRRHPAQAMAAALLAGFAIGRSIFRR
jgi:CHASE3 domain sensor protein